MQWQLKQPKQAQAQRHTSHCQHKQARPTEIMNRVRFFYFKKINCRFKTKLLKRAIMKAVTQNAELANQASEQSKRNKAGDIKYPNG